MLHRNAEPRLTSAPNVVAIRPTSAADRLELLARKPLTPRRRELRMLAARARALEAYAQAQEASQPAQLKLGEVA